MMQPCPPPDPNPRAPRMAVPAGACDCHAHVFGAGERYPFAEGRSYTPPEASPEAYRAMLDALGVSRGILVQPSVYGTDNRLMLEVLERGDPRLRGVAVIDERTADAELARLRAAGVCGVRFNLLTPGAGLALDRLERIAERIAPLRWHMQVYVSTNTLPALEPIAGRLAEREQALVVDHLGDVRVGMGLEHPGFQALLRMVAARQCWVKLSAAYRLSAQEVPYADVTPYARALIAAAPERMLWGTDWPHPAFHERPMPNDGALLEMLRDWAPDPGVRHGILVDNPARLYGFDGDGR